MLSKENCFKIYHEINFNEEEDEKIMKKYNITLEELDDILDGKNEYKFLKKPNDYFKRFKPKKVEIMNKDDKKITL